MYIMVFILIIYNVIDEGMFGFSIGASKIGLGEFTESNRPVCDDALSGLGDSGLVVVRCLQNMAKKKKKEAEQNNPADVQDNNVLI
jgi:hypothetical protein